MKIIRRVWYVLFWFAHNKSGEYKLRSNLPKHEIEAIIRAFYPSVVAFYESEKGAQQFKEWKNKKETEISKKK